MLPNIKNEVRIIESMFMIADKDGNDVPFILNSTQRKLAEELCGRDVITKARQEGVSAFYLALFTVRCMYKRNTRAVVISHDKESTERLFKRVKYYLDELRGPKPVLETSSKREFSFPKTNSVFYIGTAGARKFGRGDTITDLHCSEGAFWDNPLALTAGLFQAVPRTGFIGIESTGNGRNWFYRRCMRADEGKGRWKLHFFDWQSFPEYDLEISEEDARSIVDTLDEDLEEDVLFNSGSLNAGQIQFRREKLDEFDYDLDIFKQEYPMTLEECFRATGRSIFHKVHLILTKEWQRQSPELYTLENHPMKDHRYAIGGDVGGGIGSDNSVLQITDIDLMEQVGEWVSNRFAPDVFAQKAADLGKLFNNAFITIESNNHGVTTLDNLRKLYPKYLIYAKDRMRVGGDHVLDYGLLQTSRSRPLSIGKLRRMLALDLIIHSSALKDELDTFIENENQKMVAEEGCKDDRVMAYTAFAYTFERAAMLLGTAEEAPRENTNPFLLDNIIKELSKGGQGYPIKRQVGGEHANLVSLN